MDNNDTNIRELDLAELDAIAGAGFFGDAWDKTKSAASWGKRQAQSAHNRASGYFRNMGYNDTRC